MSRILVNHLTKVPDFISSKMNSWTIGSESDNIVDERRHQLKGDVRVTIAGVDGHEAVGKFLDLAQRFSSAGFEDELHVAKSLDERNDLYNPLSSHQHLKANTY